MSGCFPSERVAICDSNSDCSDGSKEDDGFNMVIKVRAPDIDFSKLVSSGMQRQSPGYTMGDQDKALAGCEGCLGSCYVCCRHGSSELEYSGDFLSLSRPWVVGKEPDTTVGCSSVPVCSRKKTILAFQSRGC